MAHSGWSALFAFESDEKRSSFDAFVRRNGVFSRTDILRLYRRFQQLDASGSGRLGVQELRSVPGLASNQLVCRLCSVFDTDASGDVDFVELLAGLAAFGGPSAEEKARLLFRVYDVDGDGLVSNADLYTVLRSVTGAEMEAEALQQVVDRTIALLAGRADGAVGFDCFSRHLLGAAPEVIGSLSLRAFY